MPAVGAVVDAAIGWLVQGILGNLFTEKLEAWTHRIGLADDVGKLKSDMRYVQMVVAAAKGRKIENEPLAQSLADLKELLYDAEDVMDDLDYYRLKEQVQSGNTSCGTSTTTASDATTSPAWSSCSIQQHASTLIRNLGNSISMGGSRGKRKREDDHTIAACAHLNRSEFSRRIKYIHGKLRDLARDVSDALKIDGSNLPVASNLSQSTRVTSSFLVEPEVYGRDAEVKFILELVARSRSSIAVLPVVGMGGIGKTTLAQLVYNHPKVESHFQKKIWVCVSDSFDVRRVTREILDRVSETRLPETDNLDGLQKDLVKHMESKTFLIVLDDVWDDMKHDSWEKLLAPLKHIRTTGNMILVTTRKVSVAEMTQTVEPVKLSALEGCALWRLFISCAFGDEKYEEHPSLCTIGKQITKKLRGNPLAVKTVGAEGKPRRSFASVVKNPRAPITVVKMQPRGAGRRGGVASRGAGRRSARENVWRRVEEGSSSAHRKETDPTDEEEMRGDEELHQQNPWEQQKKSPEEKDGKDWKQAAEEEDLKEENIKREVPRKPVADRPPCDFCHLKNHLTRDCRHRFPCETCGCDDHTVFDCQKCLPWNLGPELCAAQVEDQSFFYIEEIIDNRMIRERSSTAVISVVQGTVGEKQIEQEFVNLVGKNVWRWTARSIGENKFLMRFPDPKMIKDLGYFRPLGMRTAKAQITIDPWSPAVSAKSCLQRGWFRIRGIPVEQRSVKTIAKVGGLVGKVVEIDEKTRVRNEYVRVRIACRDVSAVPSTVESSLGLFIYDFHFEREIQEEDPNDKRGSGIKIDDQDQKNAKRTKFEGNPWSEGKNKGKIQEGYNINQQRERKNGQPMQHKYMKAPPAPPAGKNIWNLDKGKSINHDDPNVENLTKEGRVQITDSEEEDTSDLLGEELFAAGMSIGMYDTHTKWTSGEKDEDANERATYDKKETTKKGNVVIEEIVDEFKDEDERNENLISTQDSGIMYGSQEEVDQKEEAEKDMRNPQDKKQAGEKMYTQKEDRRVSERLKKDAGIRIEEKNRRMAAKRNLEGLSKKELQDLLQEGARLLVRAANSGAGRQIKGPVDAMEN